MKIQLTTRNFLSKKLYYLVAGFCHVPVFLLAADSTAPVVVMTEPPPFSVLRSDAIRLGALVNRPPERVRHVEFYANYQGPQRPQEGRQVLVGTDSQPPFEYVWDCSAVLDQPMRRLQFWARAVDIAGMVFDSPHLFVVLDRNSAYSPLVCQAAHANRSPSIDGRLDTKEWPEIPAVDIGSADNRYQVRLCWDNAGLYIAAVITDNHLFSRFDRALHEHWDTTTDYEAMNRLYLDDCIMFLIDPFRKRRELLHKDNVIINISCLGQMNAYCTDPITNLFHNLADSIEVSTRITDSTSVVKRYEMEVFVPWRAGRRGVAGDSVGFDVYAIDREHRDGERILLRWAGQAHNHENPSEWATMVLLPPQRNATPLIVFLVAVVGIAVGAGILLWYRHSGVQGSDQPESGDTDSAVANSLRDDPLGAAAVAYITDHLEEEDLSRTTIARHLGLNADYFGRKFRQVAGMSFVTYLNSQRIQRAQTLLGQKQLSVSEVTVRCGFSSIDHFIRVFRKQTGCTPKKFQQNPLNASIDTKTTEMS